MSGKVTRIVLSVLAAAALTVALGAVLAGSVPPGSAADALPVVSAVLLALALVIRFRRPDR